ncbi:unnamed protein product [Cuscuta epithymum]|uniref:Uncharacterized protein n=1 Tax=Cuscuta epithymum TaxID=186058 RepID=A0AAV0ED51_9ASTE|nr:unnamed protein product [Cuscuta epithymum]
MSFMKRRVPTSMMHAHTPGQFINKFIWIFKEGQVFAVKNFMVEE